jgi:hypothetical protein
LSVPPDTLLVDRRTKARLSTMTISEQTMGSPSKAINGKTIVKKQYAHKFSSSCLPLGGNLDAGNPSAPKVVDHSCAIRSFHKSKGNKYTSGDSSFLMFTPLDSSEARPKTFKTGRGLHTDPFAPDRECVELPKKHLIEPNIGERKPGCLRHVNPPVVDGQHKEKVITANGVVCYGGKQQSCHQKNETTYDKQESKVIDYALHKRFHGTNNQAKRDNLSPTSAMSQMFPNSKRHGIKRVNDPNEHQSLSGVLRVEPKKSAPQYNYRPPWGTNDGKIDPPAVRSESAPYVPAPSPWATS